MNKIRSLKKSKKTLALLAGTAALGVSGLAIGNNMLNKRKEEGLVQKMEEKIENAAGVSSGQSNNTHQKKKCNKCGCRNSRKYASCQARSCGRSCN